MQSEITIKNLKKYFAEIKAVDDISFTVQKGELFGFLGQMERFGLEDSRLEYMMKRFVRK